MNDREIRESLHDYARGLLGEKERREVERALAASASLKKELERVRAYYGALDEMEPVRASRDFLEKVHEKLQHRTGAAGLVEKIFFPLYVKVPLELLGVAATVLVVVFLYVPYLTQKQQQETMRQQATEEDVPKPAASAPAETPPPAAMAQQEEKTRVSPAKAPSEQFAAAKAKRSTKPETHAQDFAEAMPEQAPSVAVAGKQSAGFGGSMADKSSRGSAAPPAPAGAPKELALSEKDEARKAAPEAAEGEARSAMPSRTAGLEAEKSKREELSARPSGAGAAIAESNPRQVREIVAQYAFNSAGEAPQPAQYEKMRMAEAKKSISGNYAAPAAAPAPEMKADRLMAKEDQEGFINAVASKFNAGVQSRDSGDLRIYSITIPSRYVPSFLDSLRAKGALTISGSAAVKANADKVTVILKTSR